MLSRRGKRACPKNTHQRGILKKDALGHFAKKRNRWDGLPCSFCRCLVSTIAYEVEYEVNNQRYASLNFPSTCRRSRRACDSEHGPERLCCRNQLMMALPFSPGGTYPTASVTGMPKRGVAVKNGDADLEFSNLAVEVPSHEALARQFHTVHLRFDAAPSVISAPTSPDGSAQVF